ncbi:MAG TPA: replication-relaxation family protein [Solirubrobacteraceae bacterium]|jgi:hypothetical protein|nr:replication-relaxation family protein [Solirubrobacteraceae bacterium]
MRVDAHRLAAHAQRQERRGGRPLTELRQPHWLRSQEPGLRAQESAPSGARAATRPDPPPVDPDAPVREPRLPAEPARSYSELVELDRAQSVRWAMRASSPVALVPDHLDWEILTLVVALRHVLTTQLHRYLCAARSITTAQRRLKRLSDAGLLDRFQFHRRDGGGVPMCYVATDATRTLLADEGRLGSVTPAGVTHAARDSQLRQARHDVHVAGWALALAGAVGKDRCEPLGAEQAVISPPSRAGTGIAIGASDLRMPDGRVPHDFVRAGAGGREVEVDRFDTLRPDAIVRVSGDVRTDVIVERDDRAGSERWLAKLERYDHFLAGWLLHVPRYGGRSPASAVVAFVCRDRARARECARRADASLRACRAYAGEHPLDWLYPGRERVLFVAERDAHEGLLFAQGVSRLPPNLRVDVADGDPRAAEAATQNKMLLTSNPSRASAV